MKNFNRFLQIAIDDQISVLLGGSSCSIRRTTEVHVMQYNDVEFEERGKLVDIKLVRSKGIDPKKRKLKTMYGWIDGKWKLGCAIPFNMPGMSDYIFRKGNRVLKDKAAHGHYSDDEDESGRAQGQALGLSGVADQAYNAMEDLMEEAPVAQSSNSDVLEVLGLSGGTGAGFGLASACGSSAGST